jgi:hypothetical protein
MLECVGWSTECANFLYLLCKYLQMNSMHIEFVHEVSVAGLHKKCKEIRHSGLLVSV